MLFHNTQGLDVNLIGLSLSFCVSDIMNGTIDPRHVHSILTSCVPSEGNLPYVSVHDFPEEYYTSYWRQHTPDEVQNRVSDILFVSRQKHIMNIADGHWLIQIGSSQIRQMDRTDMEGLSDFVASGRRMDEWGP